MNMKQPEKKQRAFLGYVLFGLLAVAINYAVFFSAKYLCGFNQTDDLLKANALAWLVSVVFSFIVTKRYVFRTSTQGRMRFEAMTFVAERMATLVLMQLALYYLAHTIPWNDTIGQSLGENLLKIGLTLFEGVANYFLAKGISFSDRAYNYYCRHAVTVTSIITAIVNYAVFDISKRLLFGIDYYMFADMLAWLIASVYFFTALRRQLKSSNSNATTVTYIICLFSFLVTHMILRFTYGTWKWNIDVVKPVLVVASVAIEYLLVQVLFPKMKLVETEKTEDE